MSKHRRPDETLHFLKDMTIEINYGKTKTYERCNTYDANLMNQGYVWHQVVVLHKGKVHGIDSKKSVLDAIFEVIGGAEFYPIAYRHGRREDKFLVRQCGPAFDKLFAQNLRIQLSNGAFVALQVQLNVGDFKFGQMTPITKLQKSLASLFEHLEIVRSQEGILNLSQFNSNPELDDIYINLGNHGVFERVCDLIFRNDEHFRNVNGLILSKNGITTLAPLKVFNGVDFALLDLQDNQLRSPVRLCHDLQNIKAFELMLAGNPVTKLPTYPDCLKSILNNFKLIDGIPVANLSKEYTPMDYEIDIDCDGFRIDWTNKIDVRNFKNSTDWHVVMIPDIEQEFSKEEIFDYFFVTISPDLSEIYPCYYKYAAGEHQFLVRNCYDQLQHLVEVCNLEIKIPRLTPQAPVTKFDGSDSMDLDASMQVQIEKTLVYYLRMNTSAFKKGQVEPHYCIENAIDKRFSVMDCLLNLDSFNDIEGLENIVINLSSPRILSSVLMQASRKLLNNCNELRLSNNKILTANFPMALTLMCNLKAIDLSNNWIHDLNDIEEVNKLGLKSLRLDGNPLCSKYTFAGEYIRAVKQYFPDLQKLDNVDVTSKGYLSTQKNFLCTVKGYDFVDQFVSHYFGIFSSPNRAEIKDMYHPTALFTMTCNFIASSMYGIKRISRYEAEARNIYKMSDFTRAFTSVHVGADAICQVLLRLPNVDFDFLSFTTDTPIFNDKMVVITVHGVFMDRPSFVDSDILMAFTRTFVLTPVERNQGILKRATFYQIVNEQYTVFNPTSAQSRTAFKYIKTESSPKDDEITVKDKEALIIMLQEITSLKSIWCTRCLEDAKWEFPKALEVFIKLCQTNEIPDTAFN